jgi:hypothetical protein
MRRLQWAAALMLVGVLEVLTGAWKLYVGGGWRHMASGVLLIASSFVLQRTALLRRSASELGTRKQ